MNLLNINYKYLFNGSWIRHLPGGKISLGKNVKIKNSNIFVNSNAILRIGDNVRIENANIYVGQGSLTLNECVIIQSSNHEKATITIDNGICRIDDHSRISCRRIWIRFGGSLSIGSYTNINSGSEIRCDERISIGSFNQISYNINIWDTNTHSILPTDQRRQLTIDKYPSFGYEIARPITKPIFIGDDCWIGENATIFKGTSIGNGSIIGYGTFLSGKSIPSNSRVTCRRDLTIDIISH